MIELNKFIDYMGLFQYLVEEYKVGLGELKTSDEAIFLSDFINLYIDDFELLVDECEFTDTNIIFHFGSDLESSNESSNDVATANYSIVFDRTMESFISCEYQQG